MEKYYHEGFFSNSKIIAGIVIIVIGVLLLFHNIDVIDIGDIIADYWPVLLILLGLRLIFRRKRHTMTHESFAGDQDIRSESSEANYSHVFGDFDVAIVSQDFQSGRISNVFGDADIDLEKLNIISGEKTLQISGVFGDIKVSAPRTVPFLVKANILAGDIKIMGEKRDGFSIEKTYKSDGYDSATNRLNIYISHVFGDIKVS
ncbi:MAG TPA: cell wall-active antibiotics response protein LiaF [bacterium]